MRDGNTVLLASLTWRQTEETQTEKRKAMSSRATNRMTELFPAPHLSGRKQASYESQQDLASVHSLERRSVAGNFLCNKRETQTASEASTDASVAAEEELL